MVNVGKYASPMDFCGIFFWVRMLWWGMTEQERGQKEGREDSAVEQGAFETEFFPHLATWEKWQAVEGWKKSSQKA